MSKYRKHKFALPFLKEINVYSMCVNAAVPALQYVQGDVFEFLHFIFPFTAPSRGKALSVDLFSLHCYLSLQIESDQNQGQRWITRNGTLPFKKVTLTFILPFFLHQTAFI